jgi:uncharacterized membrane protein
MADYNFVVAVYEGPATARVVYNKLDELQEEKYLDIKEAAVFTKAPGGKVEVQNLGFVATGKGGFLGLLIGAVIASAPVAGLAIGGLIGFVRSSDRRKLKKLLVDELGPSQSALAVVIRQADWKVVAEATADYPGRIVMSEISDEALAALEDMVPEKPATDESNPEK